MITASIICKNEESCIRNCLESIKGVDEIVAVDTGSEDKTIEILKEYTDKVYTDYKWNDSFCEARNYALSKATGDWILTIDADNILETPIEKVREVIAEAEKQGKRTIGVKCVSDRAGNTHRLPLIHKRDKDIFWRGNIHNHLSVLSEVVSDIVIKYKYSQSHQKDPDRAFRILKKEVEKGDKVRELYYLAREFFYRNDYIHAIYWFKKHISTSTFLAEKADGCLYLARCYWALREGEKARDWCLQAIKINSNFKEALSFMAELSWEWNAKSWRKFAEIATNENVLFIRK